MTRLSNTIVQSLAKHSDYVKRLAFSSEKNFLGSISHDQMLKLWDFEELLDVAQHKLDILLATTDSDDTDDDMDLLFPPPANRTQRARLPTLQLHAMYFGDL